MFSLALYLLAAAPIPVSPPDGYPGEVMCLGGPVFSFAAHSSRFDRDTTRANLVSWMENLQDGVFAGGWMVVYPAVEDIKDLHQISLVKRRERAIIKAMTGIGLERSRIRFAPINASGADQDDRDIYAAC
ncbi:hypothetical protein HZF05_20045 [Sphingomonas sp. CGMCC 1.13654]|uniref:Uncharacterized protein n=1 Tax=Sphingomonas chungangi TaxID=2683589 RepID=A0A838LBZ4_9SPHN|nr:hypothetical protein [Sphingomonas chungangi]MBA2936380.1 hypothetical protein [Sphingomonas chungangi]MVW55765.1 hypothetical protein [Sphingomonas chungangi]